jgi:hypothetical protein
MHRDGLVQARPFRVSRAGAAGGGSVRHAVPFHASNTGTPSGSSPTARHLVLLGHDTAVSDAPRSRAGVDSTRHAVPFQISLSGLTADDPALELPTAMQKFAAGHDTPAKKRSAGVGLPASAEPGAGIPAAAGAAIQATAPRVTVTAVTKSGPRLPIRVWFICHTTARQGPLLLPGPPRRKVRLNRRRCRHPG